jgi:hypothetical protein
MEDILHEITKQIGCSRCQVEKRLTIPPLPVTFASTSEVSIANEAFSDLQARAPMVIVILEDPSAMPDALRDEFVERCFPYSINFGYSSVLVITSGYEGFAKQSLKYNSIEISFDEYRLEDAIAIISPYTELFSEDAVASCCQECKSVETAAKCFFFVLNLLLQ